MFSRVVCWMFSWAWKPGRTFLGVVCRMFWAWKPGRTFLGVVCRMFWAWKPGRMFFRVVCWMFWLFSGASCPQFMDWIWHFVRFALYLHCTLIVFWRNGWQAKIIEDGSFVYTALGLMFVFKIVEVHGAWITLRVLPVTILNSSNSFEDIDGSNSFYDRKNLLLLSPGMTPFFLLLLKS